MTVQAQRGGLCPFLDLFALMAVRKQAHRFLSMRYASRSKKSICGIRKIRIKRALTRSRCWTSLSDQPPLYDCCAHFYWTSLSDQTPLSDCCALLLDISVRSNTSVRLLCTFIGHLCPIKHLYDCCAHFYWTSLSDQTPVSDCCALLLDISVRSNTSVRLLCTFIGHLCPIKHLCPIAVHFYWTSLSDQTPLSDCCALLLDISVRSNTSVRLLCTVIGHLCPIKHLCPIAVHCYWTSLSDQTPVSDCCALLLDISVRSNTCVRLLCTFIGHLCPIKHLCPIAVHFYWTSLSDQTPVSDCCALLLDISVRSNTCVRLLCTVIGHLCPIKHLCPIAVHCYWTSLSDQTPVSDCCALLLDISVRSNTCIRLLCTVIGHLCPIKHLCPIAVYCYWTSVLSNVSVRLLCTFICSMRFWSAISFCPFAVRFCRTLSVRLQCVFIGHLCPLSVCSPVLIGHLRCLLWAIGRTSLKM